MVYTPQAPVFDLREETITSTLDLRDAFHRLCLCPEESPASAEQCPNGRRKHKKPKELSDSDTSRKSRLILAIELQRKKDIMGLYVVQH